MGEKAGLRLTEGLFDGNFVVVDIYLYFVRGIEMRTSTTTKYSPLLSWEV